MSRIKEVRTKLGLTQREVCEIVGMPKRTLENWEGGQRKPSEWMENLVIEKLENSQHS